MAFADLTIQQLGPQGDGIHFGPRGRVFVDRGLPGDRIKAKIQRDGQGIIRAEVVNLVKPSPFRQPAPCRHYDVCGNCSLQHLNEKYYRDWKVEMVKDALRKVRVSPRRLLPPVFVPAQTRRRATFSALRQKGQVILGYYRRRSRQISDINTCLVADPKILAIRDAVKPLLGRILTEGKAVDIFIQLVGENAEVVITGPLGKFDEPDKFVVDALMPLFTSKKVARLSWRTNEDSAVHGLLGSGQLLAKFGELTVALPPAAFMQPTREGERALVKAVMDALPAKGNFADLFSGCGTFSGPMLAKGTVDAFEMSPAAVKALGKAAGRFPLKAIRRDLFKNPLRREDLRRYDAVVFDPPRAGCERQAEALASSRISTLVAISCNPMSFARDARILCDGGYQLNSLQLIDQFVWSHHVEVVGVFSRN